MPDELNFAFAVAEGAIKGKTKGQYPAPLVALKAIREGCNLTARRGAQGRAERRSASWPARRSPANLIGIFFMKNRLARDPGVSDPSVKPRPVQARRRAGGRVHGGRHRRGARSLGHPHVDGRRRRRPDQPTGSSALRTSS